jgi:hypothetical protein
MTRVKLALGIAVLILFAAACAAGANPEVGVAADGGDIAGFWMGLWHGIIAPFTFVVSLFRDSVNLYEVHNSGNWYDFGFMFGLSMIWGGGSHGARSSRKT